MRTTARLSCSWLYNECSAFPAQAQRNAGYFLFVVVLVLLKISFSYFVFGKDEKKRCKTRKLYSYLAVHCSENDDNNNIKGPPMDTNTGSQAGWLALAWFPEKSYCGCCNLIMPCLISTIIIVRSGSSAVSRGLVCSWTSLDMWMRTDKQSCIIPYAVIIITTRRYRRHDNDETIISMDTELIYMMLANLVLLAGYEINPLSCLTKWSVTVCST